jgi:hypothetical protein
MSDLPTLQNPPVKRRTWLQFGTRTLFVLVVLGAVAAWWARNEMAKEQRREELITALQEEKNDVSAYVRRKVPWQRRLGAWLRGKPLTATVDAVSFEHLDFRLIQELSAVFPEAKIRITIPAADLSPELRQFLTQSKSMQYVAIDGPLDPTDEMIDWLGNLRTTSGVTFRANDLIDRHLQRFTDAGGDATYISTREGDEDSTAWNLVTNDGLRAAARLQKLGGLWVGEKASDEGFVAFKDHPALSQVGLTGPGYSDASAEILATLPQLGELWLNNTGMTDAGIAKVIEKGQLTSLYLSHARIGEKSSAAIAASKPLHFFSLEETPITSDLVAALAKSPPIYLMLEGNYSDADLGQLAPLAPHLSVLVLVAPNVTDQGLTWLADAKNLNGLRLVDTQASGATMKLLSPPSPRRDLWLGGPNIDANALAQLDRTIQAKEIVLRGSSIDDDALAALQLTYDSLDLTGTRTTAKGIQTLKTNGTKIAVRITFADNAAPPLTEQEIEHIKQTSAGLIEVKLDPVKPRLFEQFLPKYARKPLGETEVP